MIEIYGKLDKLNTQLKFRCVIFRSASIHLRENEIKPNFPHISTIYIYIYIYIMHETQSHRHYHVIYIYIYIYIYITEGRLKSSLTDQMTLMGCDHMMFIFRHSPPSSRHTSIGVKEFWSHWSKKPSTAKMMSS